MPQNVDVRGRRQRGTWPGGVGLVVAVIAASGSGFLAGCGSASVQASVRESNAWSPAAHAIVERFGLAAVDVSTSPIPQTSAALIHLAPSGSDVALITPVSVRVAHGHLTDVRVTGPSGDIPGTLTATEWTAPSGVLDFDSEYHLEATAVDARGVVTEASTTFRTVAPSRFLSATVTPGADAPVGVGLPITVTFNRSVGDRAAVERALRISTPAPIEGAWSWQNSRVVQFRPRSYWPGGITATVHLDLRGVRAGKGLFGKENSEHRVTFRPAWVITVNAAEHVATVYRNGLVARVIPVTTGKPGWETRSGVKLILSKERQRIMDAATGGTSRSDPEYYRLLVQYAMRVTYSGEFLHAAPWSVRSQGHANVSHGCIGMSTTNAQWLYDQVDVGDVVEVVGTSVPQDAGNGMTLWNIPWEAWLAHSATGAVQTQSEV